MEGQCLCSKLRAGKYSDIDASDIDLLSRSLPLLQQQGKLPFHLQTLATSTTRGRKIDSTETSTRGELDPNALHQLQHSYTDNDVDHQLTSESSIEKSHLLCVAAFQGPRSSENDDDHRVAMYMALVKLDNNVKKTQLVKRLFAVALSQLHGRNQSIDPLVQRISRRGDCFESQSQVKTRLRNALRAGSKWDAIMDFCGIPGIIWVLGKPRVWEDANKVTWTKAIQYLLRTTNLKNRAAVYNKAIEQSLDHLKNSFRSRSVAQSDTSSPSGNGRSWNTSAQPRGISDTPVVTNWHNSADPTNLFSLLCFLGGRKIPRSLLSRGGLPLERWDETGEPTLASPVQSGVSGAIVDVLSNEERLACAVNQLVEISAVESTPTTITVEEDARIAHLETIDDPEEKAQWIRQARSLVCHAFPRDSILVPTFGHLGRSYLPQLEHVLHDLDEARLQQMSMSEQINISGALLAASLFSNHSWKLDCLKLVPDTDREFIVSVAVRRSVLYRLQGDLTRAAEIIASFASSDSPLSPRMNALTGSLHLSSAKNKVQQEDLKQALICLNEWNPLNTMHPSKMENHIELEKQVELGRIYRYQGNFHESLAHLKRAYNSDGISHLDPSWVDLICSLADVLCEVDRSEEALHLLSEELKRQITESPRNLRLTLSLAEAYIRSHSIGEAKKILQIPELASERSKLTKFGDLRLHITLARIAHLEHDWDSAISLWSQALSRSREFPLGNGHTSAIILQSMLHVLLEKGKEQVGGVNAAEIEKLKNSTEVQLATMQKYRKVGGCRYWIAGVGSYWSDYVRACVEYHGAECSKI